MKRFEYLIEKLKEYNLPEGDYAIFGSAPLYVVGLINNINDLDVIVRPSSWPFDNDGEYRTEDIEFFNNWPNYDINDLIDNHTFKYLGLLFVNPKKVFEYKKQMGRDKDIDVWS